jgi:hypothetical protein
MKKVYLGFVSECPYGFVALDDDKTRDYPDSLAEKVSADWKKGDVVAVRYYVSDAPMTEDEAVARLVATMYGGEMDANYVLSAYSESTVLELEDGLTVGGHDLAQELRTHVGKYVVLVIEANAPAEHSAASADMLRRDVGNLEVK